MKKLQSIFSPRKIIIWLLVLVLAFTLPTINQPALSETLAIVTMMCVDKEEDKIVAVATILTPGADKNANYQVFSGDGDTIAEAVGSISLAVGKEMGFAQCDILALGEKVCEDNVMKILDYMIRTKKVGQNALLVNFTGEAMEFATATSNLTMDKSLKLSDVINFDKRYIISQDSNVEAFYKNYYSDISIGYMPKIKLQTEESGNSIEVPTQSAGTSGQAPSGGGGSGGGQGGQGQSKYLVTDGSSTIFKKGKKYYDLTPEEVNNINIFTNDSQKGSIIVEHITDEIFNDAKVILDVIGKDTQTKTKFEQGKPVYEVKVKYTVFIDEIVQEHPTEKFLVREQEFLTDAVITKVKEKVTKQMEEAVQLCREQKMDLLDVYTNFSHLKYKQFKKYLEEVGIENFLDGIDFRFEVDVTNEY